MPGIKRVDDAVNAALSGKKTKRASKDAPRQKQLDKQIKKAKTEKRPGIVKLLGF